MVTLLRTGVLFLFLVILSIDKSECQNPQDQAYSSIDAIIRSYYDSGRFSGEIIVASGGRVLYNNAYGIANIAEGRKIEINNLYNLASIAKIFTSTAVMKLIHEGRLELDQSVNAILDDLPDIYRPVTVRHLLTHTSGVPDYLTGPVINVGNDDVYRFIVKQDHLDFQPGEKYKYSNSGFVLLALIVERVTGDCFAGYLEDNLFSPAGMNHTFVGRRSDEEDIVTSYHISGSVDDRPNFVYGPGEVYSTASDLLKWDQFYFGSSFFSDEERNEIFEPAKTGRGESANYGLGWGVLNMGGEKYVGHTGGNYGFRTLYEHQLGSGNIIIILTNIGDRCPLMEIRNKIDMALR